MELNLPPPPQFLALPGEPPVPWVRWLETFENYIDALGLTEANDVRRRALLIHCLGTEGQRIFRTLGQAKKYKDATKLLEAHFAAPQTVILRRILFRQRKQNVGESIQHYVADLRGLASLCKFGSMEDEMIRDQLAEHASHSKIREKLIMSPDDLTLPKALEIALQIETATELTTKLSSRASALPALTQHVEEPERSPSPTPSEEAEGIHFTARPQFQSRRSCGDCGSSSHSSRAPACPARGQVCKKCGKSNHFARVCRSAPATTRPRSSPHLGPRPGSSSAGPTAIHSVSSCPAPIQSVDSARVPFKTCSIELDGVCVPLLLDTGAAVSLLNLPTVQRFLPQIQLQAPSAVLHGYGNSSITLVGSLICAVRHGNKCVPAFTFQVAQHGANLMGLDLITSLGFTLLDSRGAAIFHVGSPWEQRWPQLFSGLGSISAFTHQPLLRTERRPVIQPLRRIPLALRDDVTAELKKLLEGGIIEPVDASPWISNLVIAKKKSGGLRVCVDLRAVNQAVIPDKYPLPTAEELTSQFYGSKLFSKLDLRQGYLQVPLHPDSRSLTAFVTHAGVFRYTKVPFGLCSAPSCFQKIMSTIFAGIPGVVIFLDDIVVHGPTPAIHDQRLTQVLDTLTSHNLTLNGEKCLFSAPEVEFVGFRLTPDGLSPLQSNIEAIQRLPMPASPAQLASFLGMTAYYLRFLPQYSAITAPLRQLLKKDATWAWTPACTGAISQLKAQLISPPVLAHFDPASPTLLTCDASNFALGAVLSQIHDGVERPIAFASRALNSAEQKYSVGEREALACVWACERWHIYLYGRSFTLRTDHQALTSLLATSGSGHRPLRIHRWYERLHQYNFTIQYTPGRENVVADLLSRSTQPSAIQPSAVNHVSDDMDCDLVQLLHSPLESTVSLQELEQASEQDPVLAKLRSFIHTGWPPASSLPEELIPFHRAKDELFCWGDHCVGRGHRTFIPASLQARVLAMVHEGHLGIVKMKQRCRDSVWWPGLDGEVEAMGRDCTACLVSGKTGPPPAPPLQPLQWPATPWEHVQLDICGELHGVPHHQRFLIVAYDLHSKWPEAVSAGSVTTSVVIDFLESLFTRWGLPSAITTDNGPQFISSDFTSFLSGRGIKHIRTAFYNPQANGGVERLNQSLKNGIRAHLAEGFQFPAALRRTLLHYRATQHSTTGSSPARLMLGRELPLPLDRLRVPVGTPPSASHSARYQTPEQLRDRVATHQRRAKQRFDRSHRVKSPTLAPLDWVRIRRPTRGHKLKSFWSAPLQVTEQLGPATFRLTDGTRWHARRLRKVPPPTAADLEANLAPDPGPTGPDDPARRPARTRAHPGHLRDYVL